MMSADNHLVPLNDRFKKLRDVLMNCQVLWLSRTGFFGFAVWEDGTCIKKEVRILHLLSALNVSFLCHNFSEKFWLHCFFTRACGDWKLGPNTTEYLENCSINLGCNFARTSPSSQLLSLTSLNNSDFIIWLQKLSKPL